MTALQPGQDLIHYRLVEKIGEGGMLDRDVAVKTLPFLVLQPLRAVIYLPTRILQDRGTSEAPVRR